MSAFDVDLVSGDEEKYEDDQEEDDQDVWSGEIGHPIKVDEHNTNKNTRTTSNIGVVKVEGETKKEAMRSERRAHEEKEVSELRARQAEQRRAEEEREEKEKEAQTTQGHENMNDLVNEKNKWGDRSKPSWRTGNQEPKIKIEGGNGTKNNNASNGQKTQLFKARPRGKEMGNEESLCLRDGKNVSRKAGGMLELIDAASNAVPQNYFER